MENIDKNILYIKTVLTNNYDRDIAILMTIGIMTGHKDNDTLKHMYKVKLVCEKLLENAAKDGVSKMSEQDIKIASIASIVHDIGKNFVPNSILLKKGMLEDCEYSIVKSHVDSGIEVIDTIMEYFSDSKIFESAKNMVGYHHEKWDGTGYSKGLRGVEIPYTARVCAIADVYDALRSNRPYKEGRNHIDSVDQINSQSGGSFDPQLVSIFNKSSKEIEEIYKMKYDDNIYKQIFYSMTY